MANEILEQMKAGFAAVDAQFERFAIIMKEGFDRVDTRLDNVEGRLDRVETRLDGVEHRLDNIENELRHINRELTHIGRRLDILEERTEGMGGFAKEIDELRAWIKRLEAQIVEHTQVKA